jgi:hypothetical protein
MLYCWGFQKISETRSLHFFVATMPVAIDRGSGPVCLSCRMYMLLNRVLTDRQVAQNLSRFIGIYFANIVLPFFRPTACLTASGGQGLVFPPAGGRFVFPPASGRFVAISFLILTGQL